MAGPSKIPNLPLFFGNDSPFPPMGQTPRQVSSGERFGPPGPPQQSSFHQQSQQPHHPRPNQSRPPPPLPPSRNEALQREQMIRQQQQQFQHQHQTYPNAAKVPSGRPPMQQQQYMAPPIQAMPQPIKSPRPQVQSPAMPQPSHFQSNSMQRPIPAPSPAPSSYRQPLQSGTSAVQSTGSLSNSMNSMHLGSGAGNSHARSTRGSFSNASTGSDPSALNIVLPDLDELARRRDIAFASQDERQKAGWCKEVFKFVERKHDGNRINDSSLIQMVDQAISIIKRSATSQPPLAEALYLRGDLLASGSFPSYFQKDLRAAFNDFELSARMGYAQSWFRIGRDYEVLGDMARSRDAYERGCSVQDIGCIYRMGMANLLGQLELGVDHGRAIPLLKEAADLANLDTPQPSYVFGMLLAGEFSHVRVSNEILNASVDTQRRYPAGSQRENEARVRIQRAAYLNFASAQFRMGYLYEYAQLECPFDPLLSVQYYSLASQGGEVEADLALSKWFLCGAENSFEKNESLAFTFADKAAAKGLPTAEFAMAYYFEIGVGCEKDLDVARKWYKRAASHGNTDAQERLEALAGPEPNALSRKQHEVHIDTKLQRKRTEAKMISDRRSKVSEANTGGKNAAPPPMPNMVGSGQQETQRPAQPQSRDLRRKQTMRMVEEVASHRRQAIPPIDSRTTTPVPLSSTNTAATPNKQLNSSPNRNTQRPPASGRGTSANPTPFQSPSGGPRRGSGPAAGLPFRPMANVPANNNSSNLPVKSAASMGPDKKVYETFDEMGLASRSAKDDKECVIC